MNREQHMIRSAETEDFVARYDGMILNESAIHLWDETGYYNVGCWSDEIADQKTACERLMEELLGSFPAHEGTILDVGCGLGATTRHLCRYYTPSNIVGINISGKQLQICRRDAPECRFEEMDATQLRFPDASFDRIICVEAAFHFNTRERFLKEAYRVMKPGAFIVLSDILFLDRSIMGDWMVPPENDLKDVDGYRDLWERIGFRGIRIADATDRCWRAFCDHWAAATTKRTRDGSFDASEADQRIAAIRQLRDHAVRKYMLVSATKGDAPGGERCCPQMESK